MPTMIDVSLRALDRLGVATCGVPLGSSVYELKVGFSGAACVRLSRGRLRVRFPYDS